MKPILLLALATSIAKGAIALPFGYELPPTGSRPHVGHETDLPQGAVNVHAVSVDSFTIACADITLSYWGIQDPAAILSGLFLTLSYAHAAEFTWLPASLTDLGSNIAVAHFETLNLTGGTAITIQNSINSPNPQSYAYGDRAKFVSCPPIPEPSFLMPIVMVMAGVGVNRKRNPLSR